jgi:hypothetical protein
VRSNIETVIGMFRQFQASDLTRILSVAEISRELKALADEARKFYDRLSGLIEERDAYTALVGHRDMFSPFDRLTDVRHQSEFGPEHNIQSDGNLRPTQVIDLLRRLPKWFLLAEHRLEQQKPGPKSGNIYWLVAQLDGIRERATVNRITRSYKDAASKDYITYVCRIADPDVGDGTLELAMKERIKARTVD